MTTKTKSQEQAADVHALLRARSPLLWIKTNEEARVERYLFEACAAAGYKARTWDVAAGSLEMDGRPTEFNDPRSQEDRDPGRMLDIIAEQSRLPVPAQPAKDDSNRTAWIMRDLHQWLEGPGAAPTIRRLRNLARARPAMPAIRAQAIIVITPTANVPPELAGHATVIDWPLPDRAEIGTALDTALASGGDKVEKLENGRREAAIDAAIGLTEEEAASCYSRSLVSLRKIDVPTVSREKKRLIARERVLEWIDPLPGGLDQVGGLDAVKSWMLSRTCAYTSAAAAYGITPPRGLFLVGVPGCGKTMLAKAIATALAGPLLRFDAGALKSKYVGESERMIRQALRVADTVGLCVLWIDEIEKALQGATSGSSDGGVSSDALGTILTWMQERTSKAFVVATANDVEALPPELMRKGRFDEIFFVDLPNSVERRQVLLSTLKTRGHPISDGGDFDPVIAASDGFTGSEVAELVPDAMFRAFNDGAREITANDLLAAARTVVPLSKTNAEKVEKLRKWAAGRARPATSNIVNIEQRGRDQVRLLDIES